MSAQADLLELLAREKTRQPFPTAEAALEALSDGREEWIALACEIGARFCARNGEFTTDDLWRECPPPAGVKGQIFGAVTRKLMTSKRIEPTGEYRKSARPECHGRPIAVYRPGRAHPTDGGGA